MGIHIIVYQVISVSQEELWGGGTDLYCEKTAPDWWDSLRQGRDSELASQDFWEQVEGWEDGLMRPVFHKFFAWMKPEEERYDRLFRELYVDKNLCVRISR
jgi:hypothetical protein